MRCFSSGEKCLRSVLLTKNCGDVDDDNDDDDYDNDSSGDDDGNDNDAATDDDDDDDDDNVRRFIKTLKDNETLLY